MADTQQLLLQAAGAAVQEHQAGRLSPSVEDILHLEKRWSKLPGASAGSVALEDVTALLGAEVLAGEPLEYVVGQVFPGGDIPAVLSKRQFLALAHVAEVAQSKAFDLVTAEDALRAHAPPSSHKKRPLAIRDARIDRWHISAATPPALPEEHSDAPQYGAAAALAPGAPGPLESHLSRAESLSLPAGPLEHGARALSRQNSADDLVAAAQQAQRAQRAQPLQSGATSYQSADDHQEEEEAQAEASDVAQAAAEGAMGDGAAAREPAAAGPEDSEGEDSAVQDFTAKLNGLMNRMSSEVSTLHDEGGDIPQAAKSGLPATNSAGAAGAGTSADEQVAASGKARSSWESFNSASASAGAAAGAAATPATAPPAQAPASTPPHQPLQAAASQPMSEAVIAAAMAAGMTFAQHLQAAGGSQASPFADVNPLRQAAAAAAAAMAAGQGGAGPAAFAPPSPDVVPAGTPQQLHQPQQMIAEMMSQLSMGGASPAQLQAAAATLQQQALVLQQQQAQPAASRLGSVGSSVASGEQAHSAAGAAQQAQRSEAATRRSWKAFDGEAQLRQQERGDAGRLERRRAAAAPVAVELAPPRIAAPGIAGWEPMSAEDVRRCRTIFAKKGYPEVGGMERHCAMEYFSKLHMPAPVFHAAWEAADLRGDGRLDARAFCLFVQLLRGAQKGRAVPPRLSPEEAAALLGEGPMPGQGGAGGQPPLHIDAVRLRSVLQGQGHSRQASQASQEVAESVLHGFDRDDDDASSVDSGIAESVSGASLASYSHHVPATRAPGAHPHHRTGLGSVLGGGAPAHHPALARPSGAAPAAAGAAHRLLEVAVRSAEVRYRKPLSTPIFSVSLRDSLGRLVELPIDTHPGHYRRETATIHSSAIVKLATQLHHVPPGSVLFLEIKHWKSDKKRFSTLAWTAAPLEKLVDFGPTAARVRSGPLDLPLFKKPLDATLRRTKRLTSRAFDLHLSVRGIE